MTDCGATGSALDRSAARFISSAISLGNGNGNAQNTARAGKAISSFLGGVATTGHGNVIPGSMMPAMAPTNISQMNLTSGNVVHELSASMCNEHAAAMADNNGNANVNAHAHAHHPMNQPAHNQIGMNPMMMSHPMNHNPMLQQQQANIQMQMQMNMMQHQQMAMMQMAQQQQQHKQQQQQKQQQMNHQKVQQQNQKQQQKMEQQSMQNEDQSCQQNLNAEDEDEWHAGLESEFQNYLNSYKNDINANLEANTNANANTDVSSTNEYDDGNIEGASIERLAAAWEEAERQFTQEDDYANLASATTGYDYDYDNNTNTGQRILGRPPQHEHYTFSEESRMYGVQEQENNNNIKPKDLMAEGMKHFEEGDTSEAILCFESELQNVDGNNADAWLMLGKCHAENDQDRDAITCLENAVERDPYSSEALLALGVSYVNELDHERALKYLNNWVTHNPNYAGLEMNVDVDVGGNEAMEGAEGALHQLKALLNQAKAYDESNGNVENSVDVLEALGVVCNVTREFDEAAECFRTATTLRPDDYQLFNKLGATLANSNRSDEAQDAYQSALAIKPKYARAWLNLAISHSNLKNFDEASRCYLQALSLNPRAGHVWSYLRIALTCSEKWELLPIAALQDLKAFQEHFDFV